MKFYACITLAIFCTFSAGSMYAAQRSPEKQTPEVAKPATVEAGKNSIDNVADPDQTKPELEPPRKPKKPKPTTVEAGKSSSDKAKAQKQPEVEPPRKPKKPKPATVEAGKSSSDKAKAQKQPE